MIDLTSFSILAFSSLFTLVNPIGLSPVFISMVEHCNKSERKQIALKGVAIAFFILILFTFIGRLIFSFFGITVSGFKIAGGILFFRTGMQMLESRLPRTRSTPQEETEAETKDEIAYTPIGIPLIAGPGAISSVMIFSSETESWEYKLILLIVIAFVMVLTYLIFRMADKITQKFGTIGLRIIQRVMGLILMVIAVEFIISGIEPIVLSWI